MPSLKNGRYCKYLRKSRADELREAMGEMETLARHDAALSALADRLGIHVSETYKEIESGESISGRPEMQRLLADVKAGKWDGVLTMEAERLSRGNAIDQGVIGQAFSMTNTLVITPNKIYDPMSEADMEYFEFGLFMSRREYKAINRRLVAGRIASTKAGQFISNKVPYGYRKAVIDGKHTLEPDEKTAPVLREIFDLYESGMSMRAIAKRMTDMGVPAPGGQRQWIGTSLSKMLRNRTYLGYVHWEKDIHVKTLGKDGVTVINRRVPNKDYIEAKGLHEPLVSEEQFERVQQMLSRNKAPARNDYGLINPLSGVLRCAKCGATMRRQPWRRLIRVIHNPNQGYNCCRSTDMAKVMKAIVESLESTVRDFELEVKSPDTSVAKERYESDKARLEATIAECKKAVSDNFDRMERGVITEEDFVERRKVLDDRATSAREQLASLEPPNVEKIQDTIATMHELIRMLPDESIPAKVRNNLLRSIVERIEYTNSPPGGKDEPEIRIVLK